MKRSRLLWAALTTAAIAVSGSAAADGAGDDRIALSADGSTLSRTNGGVGGSLAWLHNFDADKLLGVAGEHQQLGVARWNFGSVNGAWVFGPEGQRYAASAEAHEGTGNDGPRHFRYSIEAVGLSGTYFKQLTALVEDRQIRVESTRGNLPKVQLAYLWNAHLQTSVSYSRSVSGNLGTRLGAARLDVYGPSLNYLAGVAYGPASAAVLGLGITVPVRRLKEGYVGIDKPLPGLRSDLSLIADYQDLSGSRRATLTLNYIFHVGSSQPR